MPDYDAVFRNALIYDGTGAAPRRASLAIKDDRIAALGEVPADRAREVVEAGHLALAPGFIDAHTHDDRIVLDAPDMLPKISQGVTTVVTGNCGISLAPVTFMDDPPPPMNLLGGASAYGFPSFAAYAAALSAVSPAVNVVALVGHSALRLATMKDVGRPAADAEITRMQDHAREAMANGAAGFSTGLFYPTNAAAGRAEVAAIARCFAEAGGVYATHMRDEFAGVLDSIDESLATASDAGIRLVISHHKCAGPQNWGRTRETLPKLETAAGRQPVNLDVYPYTAGSTNLRLDLVTSDYPIRISWSKPYPEMTGRVLSDVAAEWSCSLHEAAERLDPAGAIYFQMHEDDVKRVMSSPLAMIGSDGLPHDMHPHPRLWGTFPRVLGHYARDMALFSMEAAVHKMTGLPARVFGLKDRGSLKPGSYADLVLFDASRVIDRATYDEPRQMAAGISRVYVNGALAFHEEGGATRRAGRLTGGNNI